MKKVSLIILIVAAAVLSNCEETTIAKSNEYDYTLTNSETYNFDLQISGDEEGAIILEHPNHFDISELKRDSTTNWSVVYIYKPETGFTGTDSVKIETNTGSDGASAGVKDTLSFIFLVTN